MAVSFESALRSIPAFSDLSDEQIDWFARNAEDVHAAAGEIIIRENDPADKLVVILEGEVRGRRESAGPDSPTFMATSGQVTGMLPFSRMTTFGVVVRAAVSTRMAHLHKDHFTEMMVRIPELTPRLVAILSDRIREVSRLDQQRDKLMALGKLSAGLAHELNNPASAAKRAAGNLRQCTRELRLLWAKLESQGCGRDDLQIVADIENKLVESLASLPVRDSLQQSDLEDEIADWLAENEINRKAIDPSVLVEAGVDKLLLNRLKENFKGETLSDVIARIAAAISVERLASEVENAAGRITELVQAVKEYSYMDQALEQEIDVHRGIENTLTMLKFRLKHGIDVTRDYDPTLPRIFAYGSELNQVWTNLIENAIDAMNSKGSLHIKTSRDVDALLIEITDNGPGIPLDRQPHIFEPFFTTKGVGSGTGLGLDTVYRVVRKHHGTITFTSKPGETKFQIRLWPTKTLSSKSNSVAPLAPG